MKNQYVVSILMGCIAVSGFANADMVIKSNADLNGSWKLEYTKKSEQSAEIIKREDTWQFNEGKVTISHIPRDGSFYDQTPVNYEIDNGKLKISLLGRSDKFDIFSLVEKDDKNMTLKGKFGDVYHFNKK